MNEFRKAELIELHDSGIEETRLVVGGAAMGSDMISETKLTRS